MEKEQALVALAALAQESRLAILMLLARAGPEGLPAERIGEGIGASSFRAAFHLRELESAGLIQSRRSARSIYYSSTSNLDAMIEFLRRHCIPTIADDG
jgi:ArsR family transcriptional regulator